MKKSESGFTLIELLVVIGIIGILSTSASYSYGVYREAAAYAVVKSSYHDARTAFSASTSELNLPPLVAVNQGTSGAIADAAGSRLLPGFMVPKNARVRAYFDHPGCVDLNCTLGFIRIDSCIADEYIWWIKFGDGLEVLLEPTGGGC